MTDSPIGHFLNLYRSNTNTPAVYRAAIYAFLDFVYGKQRSGKRVTPEEAVRYEELATQYLDDTGRSRVDDLMRFAASMAHRPPFSAQSNLLGIREFLTCNGLTLSPRDQKSIRSKLPKGHARTVEDDMDRETMQSILSHMDAKGRAFVLVLASSGMRIGELLQILLSDVRLDKSPAEINIRGEYTKTGVQRFCFISSEAAEAVREWLKVRGEYIETAAGKNAGLVATGHGKARPAVDDGRLFPFSQRTAGTIWNGAVTRAGLHGRDPGTDRHTLHIHMLRKFFRSQLGLKCPADVVEALMGHEGYLTGAYRRFTRAQMAELYSRAEHMITVSGTGGIDSLAEKIGTLEEQNKVLQENLTNQKFENLDLKARLAHLEAVMATMMAIDQRTDRLELVSSRK